MLYLSHPHRHSHTLRIERLLTRPTGIPWQEFRAVVFSLTTINHTGCFDQQLQTFLNLCTLSIFIHMNELQSTIEAAWEDRSLLMEKEVREAISATIRLLNQGEIRVANQVSPGNWTVNEWVNGDD